MNLLFPASVTLSTIATVILAQKAAAPDATAFEAAGFTMLATLMALAIAEHWFLVAPLPSNALWQWGVKAAPETAALVENHVDEASAAEERHGARDDQAAAYAKGVARGLRPVLESLGGGVSASG
jgi:hypothetical protein